MKHLHFWTPAPTTGPTIDDPSKQLILKHLSGEGLPLSDIINVTERFAGCVGASERGVYQKQPTSDTERARE